MSLRFRHGGARALQPPGVLVALSRQPGDVSGYKQLRWGRSWTGGGWADTLAHPQSYALNELGAGQSRIQADGRKFGVTASFQDARQGGLQEFSITDPSEGILKTGVACPARNRRKAGSSKSSISLHRNLPQQLSSRPPAFRRIPLATSSTVSARQGVSARRGRIARSEGWRLPR